ncbi:MAG: PAS-domain containing protein [Paracoccaceae bacterium]
MDRAEMTAGNDGRRLGWLTDAWADGGGMLSVLPAAAVALGLTLLAALALLWVADRRARLGGSGQGAAFLLRGEDVIDATRAGRRLLRAAPSRPGGDAERLASALSHAYPTLPGALAAWRNGSGPAEVPATRSSEPPALLSCHDGVLRLIVPAPDPDAWARDVSHAALEREVAQLSALSDISPQLIWQQAEDGTIVWANRAYLDRAAPGGQAPAPDVWPPRPLFAGLGPAPVSGPGARRVRLAAGATGDATGAEAWFDVVSIRRGRETAHFATDATALVLAERARHAMVQTLAKTFADLHTGLVVFDARRRLALFNPAFCDITGLAPGTLTTRPALATVLDGLRERGMLPEPRDYGGWRSQFATLEADAAGGHVQQTWELASGQVLRVAGRPHPDGAIALTFEDITAETQMSRQVRSDLEVGQSVMDAMDEAVAVFSAAGTMLATNAAYRALWHGQEDRSQGDPALTAPALDEVLPAWRAACHPTGFWADLRDLRASPDERAEWSDHVRLRAGGTLACRVVPLPRGAMMVAFAPPSAETPAQVAPSSMARELTHDAAQ